MNITTLAVGQDVPLELVDGKAPTELRLLRRGANPSTKGEYLFDDQAAAAVMAAYARMGRPWVIADYDHGSLQANPIDPSRSGRSAGRAALELRDGDLWATNIRWTPDAKAAIESEEWPSISPAFEHGEDGRPTWLINFGLTGNPALHQPVELIAANVLRAALAAVAPEDEPPPSTEPEPKPTEAPLQPVVPVTATETLVVPDVSTPSADVATPLPGVTAVAAAPAAATQTITQPPTAVVASATTTKPIGGAASVTKATAMNYEKMGQMLAAKVKDPKSMAELLGCSEDEAAAAMSGESLSAKTDEMLMGAVSLSVGLSSGVTKPKLIERLGALATFERAALSSVGATDHATALGSISGLVAGEKAAKDAVAALATVKAEQSKASVEALLSAARAEKKLTPAEVDDASETGLRMTALSMGERGTAWLSAHLAKRTPIAALSVEHQEPVKKPDQTQEAEVEMDVKAFSALSFAGRAALRDTNEALYTKLHAEWQKTKPAPRTVALGGTSKPAGLFGDLSA